MKCFFKKYNFIFLCVLFFCCSSLIGQEKKNSTIIVKKQSDASFDTLPSGAFLDKTPEYPGGEEKMLKYLNDSLKITKSEMDSLDLSMYITTVYAEFFVDSLGKTKDVKIIRGGYPAINRKIIRVISNMPKFNPGTRNGIPVPVKFTLPIRIKVQ